MPTLTEQVARHIAADIAEGVHPVGAKLPPGRKLAEQYGVSAAVIREVTERLRAQGLIQSRQGSGCTVTARIGAQGFLLSDDIARNRTQLASVYELRMELEGGAAELAAARRDAVDLQAMAASLEQLALHIEDPVLGVEHDLSFHLAVAAATHNCYYQDLLRYLNLQLRQAIRITRAHCRQRDGLSLAVHQEHVAIFEAIRDRDTERARQTAIRHLRLAVERLALDQLFPAGGHTGAQ